MSDLEIGAIVEIRTAKGLAYAQYTHRHPSCGEVVRLLPGLHRKRQQDFDALVQSQTSKYLLVPLKKALAGEGAPLAIVGWQALPPSEQRFPTFRMAICDRQGNVLYWWLWDGAAVWPRTELTEDEQQLPFRVVRSVEELIAELERETAPEPS